MKAILFDAAGTLFRVRGSVGRAYATVAARHGVEVDAAQIEARFRAAFRGMPPLCFPGVPEAALPQRERAWWEQVVATAFSESRCADFDALFEDLFQHFTQAENWDMFPDVQPTLTALGARGMRLGIVSNFDGRLITICEGLGIARHFQAVLMSSRVGYAKPDPRIFTAALARLGTTAAQTLHVGDSAVEDLEGARAAGIRAVLIERQPGGGTGRADSVRDLRELLT